MEDENYGHHTLRADVKEVFFLMMVLLATR